MGENDLKDLSGRKLNEYIDNTLENISENTEIAETHVKMILDDFSRIKKIVAELNRRGTARCTTPLFRNQKDPQTNTEKPA